MTLTVIAVLLAVFAQTPKGSIEGVVLDSVAQKPIAGAQITLMRTQVPPGSTGFIAGTVGSVPERRPQNQTGMTDSDGRFRFPDVEAGNYLVQATADGYARQQIARLPGQSGMTAQATVQAGATSKSIVLHLTPAATVSGRVAGANGEPLVGMEVTLLRAVHSITGELNLSPTGSAQTDDRGQYRLFWMPPGRYYLVASAPTRPMGNINPIMPSPRTSRYPRTFYPRATSVQSATALDLQPRTELNGLDFDLSPLPLYTVRGKVIDSATGAAPKSASISITPSEQYFGGTSSSTGPYDPATGTFELRDVLPGSYWIRAQLAGQPPSPGFGPRSLTASAVAAVEVRSSDVDDVVLNIIPAVSIVGRAVIEGDIPRDRPIFVSLQPTTRFGPPSGSAPVQSDGSFRIENLGPGEYRFAVPEMLMTPTGANLSSQPYLKQARLGSIDLLNEKLTISGPVTDVIQVVFSAKGGQISGTVTDDRQQPATNVAVLLLPTDHDRLDLYRVTTTGPKGDYTLQGLAPGSYKVFAVQAPDMSGVFDPTVMKTLEARAQTITASESSKATVDLKAIAVPPK